jgi:hypothetical protein
MLSRIQFQDSTNSKRGDSFGSRLAFAFPHLQFCGFDRAVQYSRILVRSLRARVWPEEILIILAYTHERASLALGLLRMADSPSMLDQVEMQTIIEPGWNERAQEIVRLFDRGAFRNPAQPPRDAKNMRVDGKRRKYGLQLYGIW